MPLAYGDAGYTAACAYLPEQDIGDGELTIEVVEGKLSAIVMRINGAAARSEARQAFPGMIGGPLYMRDVQQGLDQLNRLPNVRRQASLMRALDLERRC